MPIDLAQVPPPHAVQQVAQVPRVVLPARLPAQCFIEAASAYGVPALVLVAMVKNESQGRSVASRNKDGSVDYGVAQHNSRSWVPYLEEHYGITKEALLSNPCQSIRAQAYVLRRELNTKACKGRDVWCGVARYHAPNSPRLQGIYVDRVRRALDRIVRTGRFEG